jgi:hypothetical protein
METMNTANKDNGALAITAVVLLVVAIFIALAWSTFKAFHLTEAGDFGDAFTAVGSLFSALAFAGLIVTILLQRQELSLQRQDLTLTRDELAGQKAQLEAQNRTMSKELFESSLFKLLDLNRACVASFVAMFPDSLNVHTGLPAFRQGAIHVTEKMRFTSSPESSLETKSQLVAMDYQRYCLAPASDFSHYFRNLYHVFSFIERSEQDRESKRMYARMVRAQLSNAELVLLFANAQTPAGRGFREFILRYELFKVLQWPDGMQKYAGLYDQSAYGDRDSSYLSHRKDR